MPQQPVAHPRALIAAVVAAFALAPSLLRAQEVTAVAPAIRVSPALVAPAVPAPAPSVALAAGAPAAGAPAATAVRSPLDRTPVALTRTVARDSVADALLLRRQEDTNRTNTTLMIVGAVAVLVGAAVGDDAGTILIVGGAGIGLWGLYRFLN